MSDSKPQEGKSDHRKHVTCSKCNKPKEVIKCVGCGEKGVISCDHQFSCPLGRHLVYQENLPWRRGLKGYMCMYCGMPPR